MLSNDLGFCQWKTFKKCLYLQILVEGKSSKYVILNKLSSEYFLIAKKVNNE